MADTLGKYELRHVLGKGAMGVVYEGFDPIIARRVAIKTVRLPDAEDLEAQDELARFRREAQAAGRLSHPNIVGVFDYGETPELAYIVMEFVDGTTLKDVVDKKERFELAEVVRLMDGLMAGLQFSHDRGVVHRDIKPANLMLTKAGEVKIADFGIARIESSSMTQAGTMLGTPSYMSPEQFMGQTVDSRTDIYSSGVMLYQLLTGEKPFEGGLTAIMHKVLNTEPPPPSALSVTVSPAFDTVVKKAMSKRPEDRFASANDFATALRNAVSAKPAEPSAFGLGEEDFGEGDATMVSTSRPPAAPPHSPPPVPAPTIAAAKKGPPLALIGGGIIILLAVIGGAFLLLGGHSKPASVATVQQPAAAVTPPAPPPPPPMTPAQLQSTYTGTFGSLPCTLLNASTGGSRALFGLSGAGAPQAALIGAIQSLPQTAAITSNVQPIDGPYCAALDAIRPYFPLFPDPSSNLNLTLAGGKTKLYNGDLIIVQQTTPAFAGYLQTDYFSDDGTVVHLYPTPTDHQKLFAASSSKVLGDPSQGGLRMQVSAPYGTDMIISIASSTPLFSARRQQIENASDYLPALRSALQDTVSAGGKLAVAALPVVTMAKP